MSVVLVTKRGAFCTFSGGCTDLHRSRFSEADNGFGIVCQSLRLTVCMCSGCVCVCNACESLFCGNIEGETLRSIGEFSGAVSNKMCCHTTVLVSF